jgi:hypothetical protein
VRRAWLFKTQNKQSLESVATIAEQFPQRLHNNHRSFFGLFTIGDADFDFYRAENALVKRCQRRLNLKLLTEFKIL